MFSLINELFEKFKKDICADKNYEKFLNDWICNMCKYDCDRQYCICDEKQKEKYKSDALEGIFFSQAKVMQLSVIDFLFSFDNMFITDLLFEEKDDKVYIAFDDEKITEILKNWIEVQKELASNGDKVLYELWKQRIIEDLYENEVKYEI